MQIECDIRNMKCHLQEVNDDKKRDVVLRLEEKAKRKYVAAF